MSTNQVRNLGVHQDKSLTMAKHISSIIKACYYQIRCISRICKFITADACLLLSQFTVTSRMDYANVMFRGLSRALLNRLQLLQNSCARLVSRTPRREHITPVLMELHWLPVEYRTECKVLLYTYKALRGCAPTHICDVLKTKYTPQTTYGLRSFTVTALILWNRPPEQLKRAPTLESLKAS